MTTLDFSISSLNRVGKTTGTRLKRLGAETVRDLLMYFPFRYEDFTRITPISEVKPGMNVNIVGTLEMIQNKRSPRKRMHITEALISDDSGQIKAIWFNQPYIVKSIKEGDRISLAGKVENDFTGASLVSPQYEKDGQGVNTQGLVPIYHLTSNLSQKQVRFLIHQVLPLADEIREWLPNEIMEKEKLMPLPVAVKTLHKPESWQQINRARRRFGFEELFLIQLKSTILKRKQADSSAEAIEFKEEQTKNFVASLPFNLTDGQKKAAWKIIQDMGEPYPMARLLDGDVGSGKTIVAFIAMLNVAWQKGRQTALMAPTEILAKQHFDSFTALKAGTDINLALFTRSFQKLARFTENGVKIEKIKKEELLILIGNGEVGCVIGTHAIIQESVTFKNLVLAIIDEQHRFGVEQRKKLLAKSGDKKTSPHLLSMTATPIPRSLALILYGDLKVSLIKEMPKGRKTIVTKVVNDRGRGQVYAFIRQEINKGRQAFVVCPLIDESDTSGVRSVKAEYKKLNEIIFPDIPTAMIHGKLKGKEKEEIMTDFKANRSKILVSTSVIEVGVDAPNAVIMMIEAADRFGLAQLHQFRGRIGRGEHESYCFLMNENSSPDTIARLNAMVKYSDGFTLAKIDLTHRGPGELYGVSQKGFPELKFADLTDLHLVESAREAAKEVLAKDPNLSENSELNAKLNYFETLAHPE